MFAHRYIDRSIRVLMVIAITIGMFAGTFAYSPTPVFALTEDDSEYQLLKTFTNHYRMGDLPNQTTFGSWRQSVWPSNQFTGDTSYYRTICNATAVSALVKDVESTNGYISYSRLTGSLLAVMNDFDKNSANNNAAGGWGKKADGTLWDFAGAVGYPCTLAAAIMWNEPGVWTGTQKYTVTTTLRALAQEIYDERPVSYYSGNHTCGDSMAEIAANDAAFMAALSQFDRFYTWSDQYLTRAQSVMQWAYNNLNKSPYSCNTSLPAYVDTVTNHNLYPYPHYTMSIANESSRAILPWVAQGLKFQDTTSGMYDINPLISPWYNNHRLIGGSDSGTTAQKVERPTKVTNASLAFLSGLDQTSPPRASTTSNWTWTGTVYNTSGWGTTTIQSKSYLGKLGVSEWGIGADFQNTTFVYPAFLYHSYSTSYNIGRDNYQRLLVRQKDVFSYDGYLPSIPSSSWSCTSAGRLQANQWTLGFLSGTCTSNLVAPVSYFGTNPTISVGNQINTHFFLNSLKAFNHLVSYLYMKAAEGSPRWPKPSSYGYSTLPRFDNTSNSLLATVDTTISLEPRALPQQIGSQQVYLPAIQY